MVAILIQKLQSALASVESFPIILSNSSSTFKALTRLPKLQFRREEEEKSLADFSTNIVVINLQENLTAVEEFLWPRIQLLDSAEELTSSSSASQRNKKAGPSAEKGKAVSGSGLDDSIGSQTRRVAHRKANYSPSKLLSEVQTLIPIRFFSLTSASMFFSNPSISQDGLEFPLVTIDLMSNDEEIFSKDGDQLHEEVANP